MNTASPAIGVIIPYWKDAEALRGLIDRISGLGENDKVIIAAVKNDPLPDLPSTNLTIVQCEKPSRGKQLNRGASSCNCEILLFHHADSVLTASHLQSLRSAMKDSSAIGGAYHRKFDNRHKMARFLEPFCRLHNKLGGTLYGDQSIFSRRDVFEKMGGYRDIPIMEDVEFSRRLRNFGRTVVLDPPMVSSPRRFNSIGPWKATAINVIFHLFYYSGYPPEKLHAWYYAAKRRNRIDAR